MIHVYLLYSTTQPHEHSCFPQTFHCHVLLHPEGAACRSFHVHHPPTLSVAGASTAAQGPTSRQARRRHANRPQPTICVYIAKCGDLPLLLQPGCICSGWQLVQKTGSLLEVSQVKHATPTRVLLAMCAATPTCSKPRTSATHVHCSAHGQPPQQDSRSGSRAQPPRISTCSAVPMTGSIPMLHVLQPSPPLRCAMPCAATIARLH